MERNKQIIPACFVALVLAGCGREIKPTAKVGPATLEKTGVPTQFIPTLSPTVSLTPTFEVTLTAMSTATPENLKCVLPLEKYTVTSPFLEKRLDFGQPTLHLGLDISTGPEDKKSTLKPDIKSPCKGIFLFAGLTPGVPFDSLGNVVVIQYEWNGKPVYAVFAHLDKTIEGKKEGDIISTGEIIGKMGNSGTDYIHLHLQLWNKKGWEEIVVGINNQRLERYSWPHVASTYPHWDQKEIVEKYLINPFVWLKNIT